MSSTKLFLLAAAMTAPVISAQTTSTVTLNLYGQVGTDMDTYAPDYATGILGSMDCEIIYNADGTYTIPNFLGVNKAKLDFYIDKEIKQDAFNPVRYSFMVNFADVPAIPEIEGPYPTIDDYSSLIVKANDAGTKFNIRTVVTEADVKSTDIYGNLGFVVAVDDDRNKTGVFSGEDADYILLSPSFWCLNKEKTTMTAIVKRSYFTEDGNNNYTVVLQGSCPAWLEKIGEEWPTTPDTNDDNFGNGYNTYIVFDIPATAGIDAVATDNENAPVEYYNLQGIKVENPANGQLYIKRQGNTVTKVVL